MQKRSVVNSSGVLELKQKRRKILKNKFIIYFVFIILFIIGISLLSRIEQLNISEIKISGNIIVDTDSIESVVKKNISDNYFYIIPKTNFLIYPKEKILDELYEKYKRLQKVSFNSTNPKLLQILINEYEGKYLYCGDLIKEVEQKNTEKCYFMDSNGYIFDEAPFFSGEIYFKFYGLVDSVNEHVLGNYYNKEIFGKLINLKDSIEGIGLKPSSIFTNTDNEIYISLSTLGINNKNPNIILKKHSDYTKIIENLKAAIGAEPLVTKLEKEYSKLLYIDLRYGNKVYYKFE
jgi:cell division septal protein FtsQ